MCDQHINFRYIPCHKDVSGGLAISPCACVLHKDFTLAHFNNEYYFRYNTLKYACLLNPYVLRFTITSPSHVTLYSLSI